MEAGKRAAQRSSALFTCFWLFIAALLPRALAGRFLTIDEGYHWFDRARVFLIAVQQGDYAATNLIGHPGVTTMWLGAIGLLLHDWLAQFGLVANDFDSLRMLVRLPVAFVTALCVALAFPLLRRLFSERVALLASLLWAAEPFLVAHAQLLHLDALVTSFMMLSLLTLLLGVEQQALPGRPAWWSILGSGAAAGLALLTKSPSVVLLPMVGLILLGGVLRYRVRHSQPIGIATLFVPLPAFLAWLGAAALVWVVLWPAAWVDLPGALRRVLLQAQADGGSPHGWGNFFLGQPVADPGPLFYPVAIALRIAPWTLVGLLGCAVAVIHTYRTAVRLQSHLFEHYFSPLMLVVFVLGFTLLMSIPPKKFDRYALPVFPALDILAAYGLVWLAARLGHLLEKRNDKIYTRLQFAVWPLAIGVFAANLAWYHPYELAYFNPLLGGAQVAAQAIPIGWGEGYEEAGAYIAALPNGADRPVAVLYEPVLSPYVPGGAAPMDWALEPGRVDYAILYIDQIQRNYKPHLITPLRDRMQPVHTVTIKGIEYAYIYQIPQPVAQPLEAGFGDAIHLRGYSLDTSAVRASGYVTLTLEWEARADVGREYTMFVHVLDANGEKFGQADVPPGGERWPTSNWKAGQYISSVQRVPVRADAPPGSYWLIIGLYNPEDFARLPLQSELREQAPADGADALLIERIKLP